MLDDTSSLLYLTANSQRVCVCVLGLHVSTSHQLEVNIGPGLAPKLFVSRRPSSLKINCWVRAGKIDTYSSECENGPVSGGAYIALHRAAKNVQVEEDKEERVETSEGGVLTKPQHHLLFSPKLWAPTMRHWGKSWTFLLPTAKCTSYIWSRCGFKNPKRRKWT